MDSGNNVTDTRGGAGVPQGTPPNADAGVAGGDLATQLDALVARRLAAFKGEVVRETSDQVWKGAQRVMDQRFSRLEPVIGQMQQTVNQLQGHFQKAEDETLDPDERRQRDEGRRFQETQQLLAASNLRARQWQAHANVQRALRSVALDEQDPRLADLWAEPSMQTDPDGWALAMVTTIAQLGKADGEQRNRSATDVDAQVARRRLNQMEEQNRTLAQNAQRADDAGHLETSVPSGQPADWISKYNALRNAGDYKGARQFMEARAKQVRNGSVKRPEQF